METMIKSKQTNISFNKEDEKVNPNLEFWKMVEFNRFGIATMALLIMSIIGGIAAASGIMDSWVKLAAVAFPSTISLALILAVAPMRAIVIGAAIAVIIDVLVIIF